MNTINPKKSKTDLYGEAPGVATGSHGTAGAVPQALHLPGPE